METIIKLIKDQILEYAVEKRTLEGLSEITRQITFILADLLGTSPEATHKTATAFVREALSDLSKEI